MNFDVVWSDDAAQELAALWNDPVTRPGVTAASRAIDRRLERDAPNEGESRGGSRRILFEAPLVVTYLVDEPNRQVTVTHVRSFGRR